ncbi:uncharacterized protein cd8b [Centropristis striata]|uniref:uncharacterized protein cd8b n=1 Tax=Centropristis striata TaxID=184440 RepID=UPI0027E01B8C|nr:uncharacterized protein cd8b [Centropristis striata]
MTLLPLAWTLWTVSLWTSGSSQFLQHGHVTVFYPKILSTEVIYCDCANMSCVSVYWFRSISKHSKVTLQFLGTCNNAGIDSYGDGLDKTRFKISRKSSTSFTLRITNVTEEDTGFYSCVLKDRKHAESWKTVVHLQPGVNAPTLPPPTKRKPPVKPICRCPKKKSQDGCGSLVFWPLVGLIAGLAVALLCILYYFSRLPKKCRHNFVK